MTFAFRKRVERVDWRKLASIDVEKISRDLEFDILQDNITNVAFCNIECELDPRFYDPNFIKLFRLAQLIIEYLLHSQDYLSHTVVQLEERCKSLVADLEKEKASRVLVENDLHSMKDEVKKYKKTLSNQRTAIKIQNNYPCPFCPKNFLTSEYVRMHINRRHADETLMVGPVTTACPPQPLLSNPSDPAVQACSIIEKLECEVKGLREEMGAERTAKHEDYQRREWEQFKLDLLESHKQEVEMIRDLFIREIDCLKQNQAAAEHSVEVLQQQLIRAISPTNMAPRPCASSPPPEPTPKEDFNKLRKHLAEQVFDVANNIMAYNEFRLAFILKMTLEEMMEGDIGAARVNVMVDTIVCQRMKEQEDVIQKKIRYALKEHNQELEKLNVAVSQKLKETEPSPRDDILQSLCENTKEHAKVLRKQQKKIEDLITSQEEQRHMQLIHEQLQQMKQAVPAASPPPSPEKKPLNGSKRHSDSYEGSPTMYARSERLRKALKKNPNLVKGLRDELSCMLHEKMQSHGIQPAKPRISTEVLTEALESLQHEQKVLAEKQPSYKKLRCQYEAQVNLLAKERLQMTSPAITTPLLHRRTRSWSALSESDSSQLVVGDDTVGVRDNVIEKAVQRMKGRRSSSVPRSLNSVADGSDHSGETSKKSPWKGPGKSLRRFLSSVKTKLSNKSPPKPKFWQSSRASKSTSELPIITTKLPSPAMTPSAKMKTEALKRHSDSEEVEVGETSSEDDEDEDSEDESEEESERSPLSREIKNGQVQLFTPPASLSPKSPVIIKTNLKSPSHGNKKDSTDWETISEMEDVKDDTGKGTLVTVIPQLHSTPTSKPGTESSTPVSVMARSLELQLSGPRHKPFGGVSIIAETVKSPKKSRMMPTTDDEDSLSLVSLEDKNMTANKKNQRLTSRTETKMSSNINATSPWQTSNARPSGGERPVGQHLNVSHGTGSTVKTSTSPWDSEDDISEIT